MRLSLKYIGIFVFLFVIEIVIAVYVKDDFVRPYLGDTIVVILIYAFVMGILKLADGFSNKAIVATAVLFFAFIIEGLQAISFIDKIGMGDIWWARIIFGTSFSWWDMLAYVGGFLVILIIEWGIEERGSR